MQTLTIKQKKQLIAAAHPLKPVVMIGRHGLTQAVHKEIDTALTAHQLIKVSMAGADRAVRTERFADIATKHGAVLLNTIGRIAIFYRPNEADPEESAHA